MKIALLIIGGLVLLAGLGLLKQGRGGKTTQQGCSASVIGCVLLIIGMMIPSTTDDSKKTPTIADGEVTPALYATIDTSQCTLRAIFKKDLNIPDGTQIDAGEQFTKTWRVRNTGTCDWGEDYQLVFIDGDQMGVTESYPISKTLSGEEVDVSVTLIAPDDPGTHRSNWQICANKEQCFGDILYVKIVVPNHP